MTEVELPENVKLFKDRPSDEEYQSWLTRHPHGFAIACNKNPQLGSPMKLHKATCIWISDPTKGPFTTRDYAKACSASRKALVDWAQELVEGDFSECGACKP